MMCSQPEIFKLFAELCAGGIYNNRNRAQARNFFDFHQKLLSTHNGHIDVEKDEVRLYNGFFQFCQSLPAIYGSATYKRWVYGMNDATEKISVLSVIVNIENVH